MNILKPVKTTLTGRKTNFTTKLTQEPKKKSKFIQNQSQKSSKNQKFLLQNVILIPKRDFASWNQHTTGFGMKMLLKMGYKYGQGLGKDQSVFFTLN